MIPLVAALLQAGLPLIANAVKAKGAEAIERKLGITPGGISEMLETPAGVERLREQEKVRTAELLDFLQSVTAAEMVDLADARRHAAALAASAPNGPGVWRPNVMVAAAWGVAFLVLWLIWRNNNLDEFTKATMSLILGRALGWIDQAFQFDFGSTRTSKAKDAAIERLSRKDAE